MTWNLGIRYAAEEAENVLHSKARAIVAAEGIEYADALERVWYEPKNDKLVDTYRGLASVDEDPEADETMSPFDAGIEVGKRVRAYLSAYQAPHHVALASVLFADRALAAAYNVGD